ncbi:MAG TPA: bifunctional phosphopantothenoylcysteine decarboxylase/phosphopantothenate--cysteine ligase CoaBC [Gemmatimonadaceae bacterium]|nr:bifunctional phosphopantothenoylcysteine decarboxylase/phosphopantothenate--cysteine ligase CoaBC [Gemmatimonadaceae bacterium]
MRPFVGRRVVLGVTGGIACYKSGWLARLLSKAGSEVDVVMTRAATEFVGPVTFEALTGRPVHTDLFAAGHALDHIRLAREAHALVVAPATADFMARAAHGRADDLLCATLLATEAPVLLVPAMNDRMWAHPQTQRNAAHLREIGYTVLDPDEGMLAAGEGSGPGRMPEPESIFTYVGRLLDDGGLRDRRIVVSAGATREPVDPVRFLSNHSTGKMGVAIAAAAWRRGAEVTLVAGHLEVPPPIGAHVVSAPTTESMAAAVRQALAGAHALIMAAAPADFRVAQAARSKLKKADAPPSLSLTAAPDILLSTRDARPPRLVTVGFALETDDADASARAKLAAKGLDLIVLNNARHEGAGFAVDTNRVTLIGADGCAEKLPLMLKTELADVLLDRVEAALRAR